MANVSAGFTRPVSRHGKKLFTTLITQNKLNKAYTNVECEDAIQTKHILREQINIKQSYELNISRPKKT